MPKPSLKSDLITAGLSVMLRQGYGGAAVRDIAREAAAPVGSFTNHFRSKEAFAGEVLDHYFEHVVVLVDQALKAPELTPRDRLARYLDLITERLAADAFERGCLIGDFSLEVVQASPDLRARLNSLYSRWLAPFEACIAEAQVAGEVASDFAAADLAEFLLASWQGAILRMKVERSSAPLERFKRIALSTVFDRSHRE